MVPYVYNTTQQEATVNYSVYLTPETKAGLERIAKYRSPKNPLTRSAVIRVLVEEECDSIDAYEKGIGDDKTEEVKP
jgi:hypothetical protein